MAVSEICEVEVKEEIQKAVSSGKTFHQAFAWLKNIYEESLQKPVSEATIKTKYYRARNRVSNETALPTPQEHTEIQENQEPRKHIATGEKPDGGAREGAGRPTKYEEDSDPLFNLKRWWKKATKKDRMVFLNWIKEESKS